MDIEFAVRLTTMEEAAVGDLLLLDVDGAKGRGILLEKGGSFKIALLRGGDVPWPRILIVDKSEACGNYGSDWFVELIDDDAVGPYGLNQTFQLYGVIYLCNGDIPVMRVGPDGRGGPHHEFNMHDYTRWTVETQAIPYFDWRIWRSREHYVDGNERRGLICSVTAEGPKPT